MTGQYIFNFVCIILSLPYITNLMVDDRNIFGIIYYDNISRDNSTYRCQKIRKFIWPLQRSFYTRVFLINMIVMPKLYTVKGSDVNLKSTYTGMIQSIGRCHRISCKFRMFLDFESKLGIFFLHFLHIFLKIVDIVMTIKL